LVAEGGLKAFVQGLEAEIVQLAPEVLLALTKHISATHGRDAPRKNLLKACNVYTAKGALV
jgi:hypothetical protein